MFILSSFWIMCHESPPFLVVFFVFIPFFDLLGEARGTHFYP